MELLIRDYPNAGRALAGREVPEQCESISLYWLQRVPLNALMVCILQNLDNIRETQCHMSEHISFLRAATKFEWGAIRYRSIRNQLRRSWLLK